MMLNLRSCPKSASLVDLLLLIILLIGFPATAFGQLPIKPETAPPDEPAKQKVETPEQVLERLQQLQSRARQSLTSIQPVLENTPPEQLGATAEEVKEKQFLLNTRIFLYGKHIESLRSLEETRLASEDLAAKSDAWLGFDQDPPYPISLVDELRDAIHAQSLAITKDEVRKALTLQEKQEAREILVASEKELRKVKEALEKPLAGDEQLRANWRHELAQLKTEVAEINVLASKAGLQALDAALSLYRKQKTFLERQLQVAVVDAPFSKEELEQKLNAFTEKLKYLEKEKRQANRDNTRNQEGLHQARNRLQKARESLADEELNDSTDEINYLQELVDARKVQADVSAEKVELLKIWVMGMKGEMFFWEERYRLANNRDEKELQKAAESLTKRLERIQAHRTYIESNLKLAQNLILNEEQRLAAGTLGEKGRTLAQQKLTAYKQQTEFTRKLLVEVDDLTRNTRRFQDDVAYYRQQATAGERLEGFFDRAWDMVVAIWNFELFVVEDTISVDGQPVTAQRPVTISKVVRALLILIIGIWTTILLKYRFRGLLTKFFRIDEGAAWLVVKFLQVVAIFILLIVALITVKIPLTAFAFMGGALAIGVGFGAQALINNFISGIILLFERPIRAGDLVEVEGAKGFVVRIGLRCSQIKRLDGIDILVPNSDFLQKTVVNWTLSDQFIQLEVKIGVACGSSTREVAHLIAHTLEEHGKILRNPEPTILFEDFGESALIFSVNFWVEVQPSVDYRIIASDLRHMLDKRFDEANIAMPFRQLDVHLDSSNPVKLQRVDNQGELPAAEKTTDKEKTKARRNDGR